MTMAMRWRTTVARVTNRESETKLVIYSGEEVARQCTIVKRRREAAYDSGDIEANDVG